MKDTISTIPPKSRYTYADYVDFPDDGQRWEIIDGRLFVSPAPRVSHQAVLSRLLRHLLPWAEARPSTLVLAAPTDLILAEDTVVQPDILVVRSLEGVRLRGVERAPELAIEILSSGTRARDAGLKRDLYERVGVSEYWIVDPSSCTVDQFHRSASGKLTCVAQLSSKEALHSIVLEGLEVPIADLFRDLDQLRE